ncbi:MAG: hypothetical protein AAF891_07610 [Pseudomonadota bacterium]
MKRHNTDTETDMKRFSERPCWREMLLNAMSGLYPSDQKLEQMMDYLERTP